MGSGGGGRGRGGAWAGRRAGGRAGGGSGNLVLQRFRCLCGSGGGLAAMGAMLVGCQFEPARQGEGPVWATYSGPTLTAELGVDVRVPAVLAAAEAALAVGICINLYKNIATVDVDRAASLRG